MRPEEAEPRSRTDVGGRRRAAHRDPALRGHPSLGPCGVPAGVAASDLRTARRRDGRAGAWRRGGEPAQVPHPLSPLPRPAGNDLPGRDAPGGHRGDPAVRGSIGDDQAQARRDRRHPRHAPPAAPPSLEAGAGASPPPRKETRRPRLVAAAAGRRSHHGEQIVALGDVHGAYDRLLHLLQVGGIARADPKAKGGYAWAGGKRTLVSVGDLIDKGPQSLEVLDLMMTLQGGRAPPVGRDRHSREPRGRVPGPSGQEEQGGGVRAGAGEAGDHCPGRGGRAQRIRAVPAGPAHRRPRQLLVLLSRRAPHRG